MRQTSEVYKQLRTQTGSFYEVEVNRFSDWLEREDVYSGSFATFENDGETTLKSLTVNMEPVQDLHGYDYPWPEGGGKNLLKYPYYYTTVTSNGITYTDNGDGSVTVNGTATANADFYFFHSTASLPLPNGSYIFSSSYTGQLPDSGFYIHAKANAEDASYLNIGIGEEGSYTISNGVFYTACIRVANGRTINNVKIYPMIRLASEADATFEPYSNICPISGWTGRKLHRTGVSLIGGDEFLGNAFVKNGDHYELTLNSTGLSNRSSGYADIKGLPEGRYTLECINCTSTANDLDLNFRYKKADGTYSSGQSLIGDVYHGKRTITLPAGATLFQIYILPNSELIGNKFTMDDFVIRRENEESEPYKGNVYNITFPTEAGTVYGGSLDVVDKKLTITKVAEVLLPSRVRSAMAYREGFASVYCHPVEQATTGTSGLICSHLQARSVYSYSRSGIYFYSTENKNIGMRVPFSSINGYDDPGDTSNSIAAIKQFLTDNEVQICYTLAEPIEIPISEIPDITTLYGDNNIWADTGDVTVKTGTRYRDKYTYGMDKLKSITIEQAMFEGNGPQIGGVYSSQCKVKLLEQSSNWPRAASFEVLIRITNGVQTDNSWLSMGEYYTDERHADKYGNLEIITFDGMLTLEQPWTDKVSELPSEWPVTAQKACDMIQEALGVKFDSRTVLDDTIPFIGLDTTSTARETLAAVAAGMGGNWHITPDRKLWLIPLMAPIIEDPSSNENDQESIKLGMRVKDIDFGSEVGAITSVELEPSVGEIARASDGEGYTLKGKCDFSDSAVAALCLSKVKGYTYKPFEAASARLDPAAELGDLVEIDGKQYQLCSIRWRIGPHITADISAPYEEVVDHEYAIASQSAKTLRKAKGYTDGLIEKQRSYITQTAESIMAGVAEVYVDKDDLSETLENYSSTEEISSQYYNKEEIENLNYASSTEISQTANDITLAINQLRKDTDGSISDIVSYVYFGTNVPLIKDPQHPENVSTVSAVVVGKKGEDNRTSVRITNDGIYLCYDNTAVSSWDQNEQLSPKALRVPVGGKLTIGSILFQPRSSGNMSLLWVGDNNGN